MPLPSIPDLRRIPPAWRDQIQHCPAAHVVLKQLRNPTAAAAAAATTAALDIGPGSPLGELRQRTVEFLSRRDGPLPLRPFTAECDALLAAELAELRGNEGEEHGDTATRELGFIACVHVLRPGEAFAQLLELRNAVMMLMPSVATTPGHGPAVAAAAEAAFDTRLVAYLQCVLVARRARPGVYDQFAEHAAREMLSVVRIGSADGEQAQQQRGGPAHEEQQRADAGASGGFPSIWRILQALIDGENPEVELEVLPDKLVLLALRRYRLRERLGRRLQALTRSMRWLDAHELVSGLHHVAAMPRAVAVLREVLPDYPMWAAWSPHRPRLRLWMDNEGLLSPHCGRLGPLIALEGPDTTGRRGSTLGRSALSAGLVEPQGGAVADRIRNYGPRGGASSERQGPAPAAAWTTPESGCGPRSPSLHERMLRNLDLAVVLGRNSVGLFLHLLRHADLASPSREPPKLAELEAALELGDDAASGILWRYLTIVGVPLWIGPGGHDFMAVLTAALPIISSTPRLQVLFGESKGLMSRGPEVLREGQKEFCRLLPPLMHAWQQQHPDVAEPVALLGLKVQALGIALLKAGWLHNHWQPAYVDALGRIPMSANEVKVAVGAILDAVSAEERHARVNDLAYRVGGSLPTGHHAHPGRGVPNQREGMVGASMGVTEPLAKQTARPGVVDVTTASSGGIEDAEAEAQDPIWEEPTDMYRWNLRERIRSLVAPGEKPSVGKPARLQLDLAKRCLEQAKAELDIVVKKLAEILAADTDQACVNLALFLASRVGVGHGGGHGGVPRGDGRGSSGLADCWKSLLLYQMRRRPVGLLDRCAKELKTAPWDDWLKALERVFGDEWERLDATRGIKGFTMEKILALQASKRASSSSVYDNPRRSESTNSSGGSALSAATFVMVSRLKTDRIGPCERVFEKRGLGSKKG